MDNAALSVRFGEVELHSQDWYDLIVSSVRLLQDDQITDDEALAVGLRHRGFAMTLCLEVREITFFNT